jgi:hypothetical protein
VKRAILIILLALIGALAVLAYTAVVYDFGYTHGAADTEHFYETDGSMDMTPPAEVKT